MWDYKRIKSIQKTLPIKHIKFNVVSPTKITAEIVGRINNFKIF